MEDFENDFFLNDDTTNISLNFHPGDLPDLDWDETYDYDPPLNLVNFDKPKLEPEPETESEQNAPPNVQMDDDSWWYSDANTPDSKYEEWFLTTILKPRSRRRYRGLFNTGHGNNEVQPTNYLKMNNFVRERCGDDDEDDFHSIHSFWDDAERVSLTSSENSFTSLPRAASEGGEYANESDNETVPLLIVKPPAPSIPVHQPELHNEVDAADTKMADRIKHLNFQPVDVKEYIYQETINEEQHGEGESSHHPEKLSDLPAAKSSVNFGLPLSERHLCQCPRKHSNPKITIAMNNSSTFCTKTEAGNRIPTAESIPFNLTSNPFEYRSSAENLHSSVLGSNQKQNIIANANKIFSHDSIGKNPSIQIDTVTSNWSSILSSSAHLALTNENPYNQLIYDVYEKELLEDKEEISEKLDVIEPEAIPVEISLNFADFSESSESKLDSSSPLRLQRSSHSGKVPSDIRIRNVESRHNSKPYSPKPGKKKTTRIQRKDSVLQSHKENSNSASTIKHTKFENSKLNSPKTKTDQFGEGTCTNIFNVNSIIRVRSSPTVSFNSLSEFDKDELRSLERKSLVEFKNTDSVQSANLSKKMDDILVNDKPTGILKLKSSGDKLGSGTQTETAKKTNPKRSGIPVRKIVIVDTHAYRTEATTILKKVGQVEPISKLKLPCATSKSKNNSNSTTPGVRVSSNHKPLIPKLPDEGVDNIQDNLKPIPVLPRSMPNNRCITGGNLKMTRDDILNPAPNPKPKSSRNGKEKSRFLNSFNLL